MTVLDAHVHLWDLAVRPQPWTEQFPVLQRSFRPADLAEVLAAQGVAGAVVVQAGDTVAETLDLLALAAGEPRLAGVVGWVELAASDAGDQIAALRSAPGGSKLVGLRHQLQLEPDTRWLTRPAVQAGLSAAAEAGIAYDVVVSAHQLPVVVEAVAALPAVRFVLDHAGKPAIAGGQLAGWRADLARLARYPNVAVKLSGLVTEADWNRWTQADLDPVIDHVLGCFGPARTMAGSDWPVCLLAADYGAVAETLAGALDRLDETDRASVLGGTARRWYGLGS